MNAYNIPAEEAIQLLSVGTWFAVGGSMANGSRTAVEDVFQDFGGLIIDLGCRTILAPSSDIRSYTSQIEVVDEDGYVALILQEAVGF